MAHGPGKENNPAEYISLHPLEDQRETPSAVEEFINFIGTQAVLKTLTLLEIQQVIKTDKTWNGLMDLGQMWQKINSTEFSGVETFPNIQLAVLEIQGLQYKSWCQHK